MTGRDEKLLPVNSVTDENNPILRVVRRNRLNRLLDCPELTFTRGIDDQNISSTGGGNRNHGKAEYRDKQLHTCYDRAFLVPATFFVHVLQSTR